MKEHLIEPNPPDFQESQWEYDIPGAERGSTRCGRYMLEVGGIWVDFNEHHKPMVITDDPTPRGNICGRCLRVMQSTTASNR